MKTVYSNTSNPTFIKWSCTLTGIVAIIMIVLYFARILGEDLDIILYIAGFNLLYFAAVFSEYKLMTVTIDEENDTVMDSRQKKYPLHISRRIILLLLPVINLFMF